ncbi:M48 family metalloprotease [Methylobacterium sp. Leaf118]|uniref:M48 family metalloprotease n=1 Tax=Methylobacterium sp. Leaf118 TaxID=2876562 RepID=UPI001E5F8951|nr:M48 family metalloprotease [Methylobacterium sp. Leaf118]
MSAPLTTTGRYFDGRSARAHGVRLQLGERLEIVGEDRRLDWSLLDLRAAETAPPLTRIGHSSAPGSVEFEDTAFADALAACCPDLARTERGGGLTRLVLWSIAAGVSVVLTALYGVPVASRLIAPLVPAAIEARLGEAVDRQVVGLLGTPPLCLEPEGRAVLDRLTARLSATMSLPVAPQVSVRRHALANALALPGGRVIILSDILTKSKSPDEFAGILAHEFGHVAARDPVRSIIRAGGTSFLLSLVLGDLTGSTVLVTIGQAAISAGYSRDAERAADAAAVSAVGRAGGDGRALAGILERITDGAHERPSATAFLRSHPYTAERARTIRATAGETPANVPGTSGLLTEAEWQTLRGICPPKETKAKETKAKDPKAKEPTAKEPTAKEPTAKEPNPKDPKADDPKPKDRQDGTTGDGAASPPTRPP